MLLVKVIHLFVIIIAISACNKFNFSKTKNIIELTPKLVVNSDAAINDIKNSAIIEDNQLTSSLSKQGLQVSNKKIIATSCVYNDIFYLINSDATVIAFNIKEQKTIWERKLLSNTHEYYAKGGILFNNNKLYITNGSRYLTIIDANTGYEVTRKEFPDLLRTPPVILGEDTLLVQTISNQLFAYNTKLGKTLWRHEGFSESLIESEYIKPIAFNNAVLANYSSGQMIALDKYNGNPLWLVNLLDSSSVSLPNLETAGLSCDPILDKQYLYLALKNKLLKFDLASTRVVWEIPAYDIQNLTIINNQIFLSNNARQVAIVDALNGKIKWTADLVTQKKPQPTLIFRPLLTKNENGIKLNYITGDGSLYSFDYNQDTRKFSSFPNVKKIKEKNISYAYFDEINYIITNNNVLFINN